MLEADGIIFASPNYTLNVSAHMKALLDRCNCSSIASSCAANMAQWWPPRRL